MLRVNNAFVIVQSPSMAREAALHVSNGCIKVMPFVPEMLQKGLRVDAPICKYDFVYVASGEPHKNHKRLIEAWEILGAEGVFPSLALTVDEDQHGKLAEHIRLKSDAAGLRISNIGVIPRHQMPLLYAESSALIYPSLFESYGLPLIEASQAGLPLVAAESDYVRDVCAPAVTFDPASAVSIARAVKRYLGLEKIVAPLTPQEFLIQIRKTSDRTGASS